MFIHIFIHIFIHLSCTISRRPMPARTMPARPLPPDHCRREWRSHFSCYRTTAARITPTVFLFPLIHGASPLVSACFGFALLEAASFYSVSVSVSLYPLKGPARIRVESKINVWKCVNIWKLWIFQTSRKSWTSWASLKYKNIKILILLCFYW